MSNNKLDRNVARDIIAIALIGLLCLFVVIPLATILMRQLHNNSKPNKTGIRSDRIPINSFFRLTATAISILYIIQSVTVLLNEIFWATQLELAQKLELNLLIIAQSTIILCTILVIYAARLYYTFHGTQYEYPRWIFIVIISVSCMAGFGSFIGDILWRLTNSFIGFILVALSLCTYLIVSTCEVILFVHAISKVRLCWFIQFV